MAVPQERRHAGEFNAAELVWPDGTTGPEQTTALGELPALNLIAR